MGVFSEVGFKSFGSANSLKYKKLDPRVVKERENKMKNVIGIIIVIAIIVGGVCFWIFWTGYDLADDMLKKEELTYLTYRLKLDNLYGLKKRGFIYYCENNTNINEVIQKMNDYVTYNSLGGWL